MAKSRDFPDVSDDHSDDIEMSDAELEALLMGHEGGSASRGAPSSLDPETLEAGTRVSGTVVDYRGGEVLVELDSKSHGVIEDSEFEEGPLPEIGSRIEAIFERYDAGRELSVLAMREARREIFWEELYPGMVVEGQATSVNKGGLTLDIKGIRAFLPISQIERQRVDDASPYVGKRLRCEVTSFDREDRNLVVSRRVILDREAEELKGQALARLSEGEVLQGTVTRLFEHGALVDLGGVEGLLHQSKIIARHQELGEEKALHVGQVIEVEVIRVDPTRGRVSLDFHHVAGETWSHSIEAYAVGTEATGWVTRLSADGVFVALEEGVEGFLPRRWLLDRPEPPHRGSILRVVVDRIDLDRQEVDLRLADEEAGA